jgi:hypothetical protein
MVQFGISDYLVFLPRGPPVLLVAGMFITVIFYVVASMDKTLSRS